MLALSYSLGKLGNLGRQCSHMMPLEMVLKATAVRKCLLKTVYQNSMTQMRVHLVGTKICISSHVDLEGARLEHAFSCPELPSWEAMCGYSTATTPFSPFQELQLVSECNMNTEEAQTARIPVHEIVVPD